MVGLRVHILLADRSSGKNKEGKIVVVTPCTIKLKTFSVLKKEMMWNFWLYLLP